ncbi:hypothetical protein OL233_05010 [Vagococcus sp. PNs007]|uniref:Transposase n=1 Tax=Vagococcus proximus TaxID=2991417 RepID=A0ABT5X164_9ENTE|nr:hypothetical protein [Vagococcus proximus]MDF0479644.1 hypothetical protein [Vagococcus proximus]
MFGVKSYIKKNYAGEEQERLLKLYTKFAGVLKGNFYIWENEFYDLSKEEQNHTGLEAFLTKKIKQVMEAAKVIREEELLKEQAEEEEASGEFKEE